MTSANLHGFTSCVANLMCFKSFTSSKVWSGTNLERKSLPCKPIGGEYQKLNSFFQRISIAHHVSCPHAHQQNGSTECKHHHIVEVGLSFLAHASMPLKLWDEAFVTATYLINRLPSNVIHGQTPLERLYKHKPDYTSLRTFGCACWSNLRPFNSRKLQFWSKQCVFLGYSNMHKGYKCLDVGEGRVYISGYHFL
jgi:histone deacetylase 1/2